MKAGKKQKDGKENARGWRVEEGVEWGGGGARKGHEKLDDEET